MSNTKNNNEQIKSVKEIGNFISTNVNPLVLKIADIKHHIADMRAEIYNIKLSRENARVDEVVEQKVAPSQPVQVEQVVEEVKQETPAVAVEETPKVEEKPVEPAKTQSAPEKKTEKTPRTYVNPDIKPDYRNNKPNQGKFDLSQLERKPRPNKNNNQNQTPRNNQNNNKSGFGSFQRVEPIEMPNLNNNRGDKKKKNNNQFNREESHKGNMSKRDLLKKGYTTDDRVMDDGETARYVKVKKAKKNAGNNPQFIKIEHAVLNSEIVPIKVFSEKIGKSATEIVKKLFDLGKVATINGSLTFDEAEMIAIDYGITLELKMDATAEDKLKEAIVEQNQDEKLVKRPPIVTIMGHVDHGKTSLLDYIRKTNVVAKEAGGITQHIGAYTIDLNGGKITFLDTPGHEAFTAMRMRGAKVTDIAIIVVAADDGIMPQTVEAINHAKSAGVSIIVAVNKIDKTEGKYDKILQQLTQYDLVPEEWGGDVIVCPISAKYGQGVQELLENVLLVAEVLELKANKKCKASGSIIEARLDKGIGPVATVLVQNGTLKVKDYVVAGTTIGKIRAMTDYTGKQVKEAGPSYAVQVQGFSEVPTAGVSIVAVEDEKLAKQVVQERLDKERNEMQMASNARTLDDMFKNVTSDEIKSLSMIIKADVQGSSEAIKQSMLKLSDDMSSENVKIRVVHSGVGAVNESDVMLAGTTGAIIIGFNVRPDSKAKALAERSGVDIRNYSIIYDAIDDVTQALKGMLTPKYKETLIGHAEVRAVFKISSYGTVAGSYILDGKVSRNCGARLLRDNVVIFEGTLSSLKREKDDVKEVNAGFECGIGLEKFNDIKVGDIIESYIMERIENE